MGPEKSSPVPNTRLGASFSPRALFSGLIVFLLLHIFACAAGHQETAPGLEPPAGSGMVPSVPFYPQLDFQCGPASLAGVLNYHGAAVSPDEIARAIYRKGVRGTLSLDMVLYARDQGFSAEFYRGSFEDIVASVDACVPLVVMVDLGLGPVSASHYMVVVGYTREGVVVNSGEDQKKLMAWKSFLRGWARASRWTLRVAPRGHEQGINRGME